MKIHNCTISYENCAIIMLKKKTSRVGGGGIFRVGQVMPIQRVFFLGGGLRVDTEAYMYTPSMKKWQNELLQLKAVFADSSRHRRCPHRIQLVGQVNISSHWHIRWLRSFLFVRVEASQIFSFLFFPFFFFSFFIFFTLYL